MKKLLCYLLCLLLTACATAPQKAPLSGEVQLQGMFSLVTPQAHESGHFSWQEDPSQQFNLELYGPLGLGATRLVKQNDAVTLETAQGKTYTAGSPEQLLQNVLGWSMPVEGMTYWLLGVPVPHQPFTAQYQGSEIVVLNQAGWVIHYTWSKTSIYPQRILMQRTNVRLLVVVSH